jgi:hypothetical protein
MVNYITITLYNSAGVQLGSVINVNTSIWALHFNFNNQYYLLVLSSHP